MYDEEDMFGVDKVVYGVDGYGEGVVYGVDGAMYGVDGYALDDDDDDGECERAGGDEGAGAADMLALEWE